MTTISAFGIQGVLEVGAGRAEVVSRIVDDAAREVIGTVDVSRLDLLGGTIQLSGLHWEALHRSGTDAAATGSFSVKTLTIGGVPVPVPSGAGELATVLGARQRRCCSAPAFPSRRRC